MNKAKASRSRFSLSTNSKKGKIGHWGHEDEHNQPTESDLPPMPSMLQFHHAHHSANHGVQHRTSVQRRRRGGLLGFGRTGTGTGSTGNGTNSSSHSFMRSVNSAIFSLHPFVSGLVTAKTSYVQYMARNKPYCPLVFIMFFLLHRRSMIAFAIVLAVYAVLGLAGIQNMGIVGDVAWSWMSGNATTHHPDTIQVHRWGPFTASSTRPMETVTFGEFELPLMINMYTGAIADWPARILAALGAGYETIRWVHWALGGLFIFLIHRFLRIHGSGIAAYAAALIICTDWGFVFFVQSLGGTEILLQAAVLLCLWALWSRRWAGGRHGLSAFALGVALGLGAKFTFLLSLGALVLTAFILRWDKPRLQPPLPNRWGTVWLCLLIPTIPLCVGWLHHGLAAIEPIPSHNFLSFQFERIWEILGGENQPPGGPSTPLLAWVTNPLEFLATAWQADVDQGIVLPRLLGFVLVCAGCWIAWQTPDATPRIALTRFCSLFLVLQVFFIWLIARDLQHLAIATPTLAIVGGLSIELLAADFTPHKSFRRAFWVTIGCLPWVWSGISAIAQTDQALDTIPRPTISKTNQTAVVELIQSNRVQRLITLDYESAGALDILAPDVRFTHGWPLIAQQREKALDVLLMDAKNSHVLVVPNAPRWHYNLTPPASDLDEAAARVGVALEAVDRLHDDGAVLYAVGSRRDLP